MNQISLFRLIQCWLFLLWKQLGLINSSQPIKLKWISVDSKIQAEIVPENLFKLLTIIIFPSIPNPTKAISQKSYRSSCDWMFHKSVTLLLHMSLFLFESESHVPAKFKKKVYVFFIKKTTIKIQIDAFWKLFII